MSALWTVLEGIVAFIKVNVCVHHVYPGSIVLVETRNFWTKRGAILYSYEEARWLEAGERVYMPLVSKDGSGKSDEDVILFKNLQTGLSVRVRMIGRMRNR
jgi:hypothetical protein